MKPSTAKQIKPPSNKLLAADFEAHLVKDPISGKMMFEVNLAMMANLSTGEFSPVTYSIKSYLDLLMNDRKRDNSTIFFHNMGGFDGQFLINEAIRRGNWEEISVAESRKNTVL